MVIVTGKKQKLLSTKGVLMGNALQKPGADKFYDKTAAK